MISKIRNFLNNNEGAETLEYVVIVAIIIIIGATAYNNGLSTVISTGFSSMTSSINAAPTAG